ncbi:MAG: NYN domain-containing protein [Sphaerochaetaceae bacterium]|nr:NYN domain-containing protein [Sphaerochaetaceae bacterium]
MNSKDLKFAVLIDSDNIAAKYISVVLDEVTKEGIATYKRIYGDWTSPVSNQWKSTLLDNSIIPVQQYSYTQGKNSTDSAMIIDAMDILYSGQVDGFCLISSDSDFTRLAARLREAGMKVIGMGEKKTPKPFIASCNQFKYLDRLWMTSQEDVKEVKKDKETTESKKILAEEKAELTKELNRTVIAIRTIINEDSDDDGWIFAGHLGSLLVKRYPDFDVRNFGYSKMTPFLESIPNIETRKVQKGETGVQMIYVRNASKRNNRKHN